VSLIVELHRDQARQTVELILRVRGHSTIVIDKIPFHSMTHRSAEDFLMFARKELSTVYEYCSPRTHGKVAYMTWDQATQTSEFLKGTI
jgi:hypothetical protein